MKRRLLYAASVAAITAFSVPAFAESPAQAKDPDSTGQTQINPGAQQFNAESDTDMTTTASIGDLRTLTPVMAAGTTTAGQIQTISAVSSVRVVRVDDWASADKQAFDAAMSQSAGPVRDLRAALAANTVVNTRLTEQRVMPDHVVATQVMPDGSLVVYTYGG
jgi:hypothetical protein